MATIDVTMRVAVDTRSADAAFTVASQALQRLNARWLARYRQRLVTVLAYATTRPEQAQEEGAE